VRSGGAVDPRAGGRARWPAEAARFELDRDGFRSVRHDTKVADFSMRSRLPGHYPEMEALVKAESGASRVVVFDHTLRSAAERRAARRAKSARFVRRAHKTIRNGLDRSGVRDLLPEEPTIFSPPLRIIQVWRPIRHPVETFRLRSVMPAASRSRIS